MACVKRGNWAITKPSAIHPQAAFSIAVCISDQSTSEAAN